MNMKWLFVKTNENTCHISRILIEIFCVDSLWWRIELFVRTVRKQSKFQTALKANSKFDKFWMTWYWNVSINSLISVIFYDNFLWQSRKIKQFVLKIDCQNSEQLFKDHLNVTVFHPWSIIHFQISKST